MGGLAVLEAAAGSPFRHNLSQQSPAAGVLMDTGELGIARVGKKAGGRRPGVIASAWGAGENLRESVLVDLCPYPLYDNICRPG